MSNATNVTRKQLQAAPERKAAQAVQTVRQNFYELQAERGFKLFQIRCDLKRFSAGLQANELFELVCALREGAAVHLVEARESLLELSCDLDGVIHPGERQ